MTPFLKKEIFKQGSKYNGNFQPDCEEIKQPIYNQPFDYFQTKFNSGNNREPIKYDEVIIYDGGDIDGYDE